MIHRESHPEYVDGCFGCKALTLKVAYSGISGSDRSRQKKWDADLDAFRAARAAGIQPETTNIRSTRAAVEWSAKTGIPYSQEAKADHDFDKALERNS